MSKNEKATLLPRLRFPEFQTEWTKESLSTYLKESRVKGSTGNIAKKLTVKLWGKGVFEKQEAISGSENTQYFHRKKGQFIYSKLDFLNQAFGIVPEYLDGYESTVDLPCFDISPKLNSKFLLEYVQRPAFYKYHGEIADGGRKAKRIQVETFLGFSIAISELPEQKKIADCLSSLDDLITAEDKKLSALKDHKKGLMQKLFPAEGKTVPELRFPEFIDSGEWEEKKLGIICNILQGYGFPIEMQGKSNSKYSFYKVSDISYAFVNSGGILVKAANSIDVAELAVLKAKIIPKGTTVFAKIGEALKANKRAFTTADCLIDNNVVGIKAKSNATQDYFIFLLSQLFDLGEHCGGVIPSVSKTALENIKIPFIKNHEEQQKIADCLSSLDDLIATEGKKLEELNKHKKGLMQGLFPSVAEVDEWM